MQKVQYTFQVHAIFASHNIYVYLNSYTGQFVVCIQFLQYILLDIKFSVYSKSKDLVLAQPYHFQIKKKYKLINMYVCICIILGQQSHAMQQYHIRGTAKSKVVISVHTHIYIYIYVINEDHNFRRERKPCVSFGPWYNTEISECAGRARKSIRVHPLTFPAGWDAFRAQPLDNKT